jgi:hypothetical protein
VVGLTAAAAVAFVGCASAPANDSTLDVLRSVEAHGACVLRPIERAQDATPFPLTANPFVSDNPQTIRFVSMWALMPSQSEEELATYTEEQFEAEVQLIESVCVAVYEPAGGGPETGVYGLQFAREVPPDLRRRLESNLAIVSGRLAVLVWTDAQDRGCYDALRAMVGEVLK